MFSKKWLALAVVVVVVVMIIWMMIGVAWFCLVLLGFAWGEEGWCEE